MRRATFACMAIFLVGSLYGFFVHRDHIFPYCWLRVCEAQAEINPLSSSQYRMRVGVLSSFPVAAKLVMVGDSLTEVMNWRAAFPDTKISNQGISGDTTVGLFQRLALIERTGATTVAIMIGVNDFQRGEPVDRVYSRIMGIVDRLKGRCVIVQSVLPTRRGDDLNEKIQALNGRLKTGCEGNRCTFADIAAAVAPNGELSESATVDGLHLSGGAYMKWRDALMPFLKYCRSTP